MAAKIKERIATLMEKQKSELVALMNEAINIGQVPARPKMTLKRLPMWGTGVTADKVNFEWPST